MTLLDKPHPGLGRHLSMMLASGSPVRLRLDLWNRVCSRVATLVIDPHNTEVRFALEADIDLLSQFERFFVYPGYEFFEHVQHRVALGEFGPLRGEVEFATERLSQAGEAAALFDESPTAPEQRDPHAAEYARLHLGKRLRHFVLLGVANMGATRAQMLRDELRTLRHGDEDLWYDVLIVPTAVDALCAALINPDIQVVVMAAEISLGDRDPLPDLVPLLDTVAEIAAGHTSGAPVLILADMLDELRPHVDRYLMTDESLPMDELGKHFDRTVYRLDNPHEIHMSVLESVRKRIRTPFFDALKHYAEQPIGNFHALPIARGHSVFTSRWIHDMAEFYGINIFLAETSSTSGGLDSLLDPHGPIRDACKLAAKCFGSDLTFFATNGTSTSNKVVVQGLVRPGDIVLVDRNCHKSHHYAFTLTGALPLYLDAYPVQKQAIYGAVPLETLKRALLELKAAGRLDRVRLVILTNCTFDGIVYHPLNVMRELLAIKPDLCFLWDEAWYAFATFGAVARHRTGMYAAKALRKLLDSEDYAEQYEVWKQKVAGIDPDDIDAWVRTPMLADPELARVRVYATQSTHKSLSALRQGSMIHIRDEDYPREVAEPFHEAFNAHTSTSPNYQILASLDLARRQADLEGYAIVKEAYHLAFELRLRIANDPLLSRWFSVLEPADLIPEQFRQSGLTTYSDEATMYPTAWEHDEFVLDPTRVTLRVAQTGLSGDDFRTEILMNRYGIQVNKTSINSVLLIFTIGVQYGGLAYLLSALRSFAEDLDRTRERESPAEALRHERRVGRLTDGLPPLPDFSQFHDRFRPSLATPEGDIRTAYFMGYDEEARTYVTLAEAAEKLAAGQELVATAMVVPYPPGFPVLVPGQVVTSKIIEFLTKLDVKEIHGYDPDLGLSIFTDAALELSNDGMAIQPRKPRGPRKRKVAAK